MAAELPEVLLKARANSTVSGYSGAFNKWIEWTLSYSKESIPAEPLDISLYLIHLSHSANSPAPLTKALSAIAWAHKLAGVDDPTKSSVVTFAYEGLKRKLAKPISKKEPITTDIINELVKTHLPAGPVNAVNLNNLRTVAMCVVAYSGFLRFNELSQIKLEHLTFTDEGVVIFIPSSKTDVYRQGKQVMISKGQTSACPVSILKQYISLAQVKSHEFIFRSLSKIKNGHKLRVLNKPMSYSRTREIMLDSLRPIVGNEISKYGVHSFRSGGVSTAANAGIHDRLLKKHGRWKTDVAKDGYVKDNKECLLSVTKSLGL